ncbi:hypothetical protein F5Y08DRAFT_322665 [Xylaria arbuscula]|nr:hypothetical protein F5Y08DRAFT_322665 [Xylaria arbuscula]
MQAQIEAPDRPPCYAEAAAAASTGSTDDVIQPTILLLAGQTIHAETASSAPLYHLDRGIASLTGATSKVTLERVERTIRTSSDNEPSLRDRRRHVFTLEHSNAIYNKLPSNCPRFYARASTKRALGHIGLKKARLRSGFRVLPVDVTGKGNSYGMPEFIKDAQPIFELHKREERWEWEDKNGNAVAVEDEGEDTHRLIVTAPLLRETVDALVALWCLRLWQYSADHAEQVHEGMDGIRRKLRQGKNAGVSGMGGWVI